MNPRIAGLDVAKGLGILLVVIGHNPLVLEDPLLFDLVFSFHVPLFLFLSGVFFHSGQPLARLAAARADALLKPYFATLGALAAFQVLARGRDAGELAAGILYGTGATIAWIPLWFLPYLWTVTVLAWLVWRGARLDAPAAAAGGRTGTAVLLRRAAMLAVLLAGGVAALDLAARHPLLLPGQREAAAGLPWSLDLAAVGAFYFLLGRICRERLYGLAPKPLAAVLAAAAFALLHGLHGLPGASMDLNLRRYDSAAWSTAAALLGIYLALQAAALLQRWPAAGRPLRYIGSGTLFILLFHGVVQARAHDWLTSLAVGGHGMRAAAAFALGVAVPLAMWEAVRRCRPLAALLLPRRSLSARP